MMKKWKECDRETPNSLGLIRLNYQALGRFQEGVLGRRCSGALWGRHEMGRSKGTRPRSDRFLQVRGAWQEVTSGKGEVCVSQDTAPH